MRACVRDAVRSTACVAPGVATLILENFAFCGHASSKYVMPIALTGGGSSVVQHSPPPVRSAACSRSRHTPGDSIVQPRVCTSAPKATWSTAPL